MQMDAGPDEEDMVTLEIKSDMQLILSTLCDVDMHRKVRWIQMCQMFYHICCRCCDVVLQELFGSEGVEMAVHFLKKGSDMFYSGLGHNKLLLSTVDCVWSVKTHDDDDTNGWRKLLYTCGCSVRSCIVGCYTTEDFFLAKQGVFLLLDLLTVSGLFPESLLR